MLKVVRLSIYESDQHCSQWYDHLSNNYLSQNPRCEAHTLRPNCLSTVYQAQHPQMSPPYMQQQLGAEERVSNTEPIPPHFNQPGGKRGETEHRVEAGLRFHGAGLSTHWDSGFKAQGLGLRVQGVGQPRQTAATGRGPRNKQRCDHRAMAEAPCQGAPGEERWSLCVARNSSGTLTGPSRNTEVE